MEAWTHGCCCVHASKHPGNVIPPVRRRPWIRNRVFWDYRSISLKESRLGILTNRSPVSDSPANKLLWTMAKLDRITFDPNVMGGRACIRETRVPVSLVVNLVADDMSRNEILDAYPYLEAEDIQQALQYAAWLAEETVEEVA